MHETRAAMKGMVPQGFTARAVALAWCLAFVASHAFAAEWPETSKNWFERGPGGGISVLLVSLWWLWIPLWAACSSWVAKDLGRWNLSSVVWPSVMVFPFFFAAVVAWWIPSASVGLAIMGVAWAVPTFTYVIVRNGRAPNHEKVLTPGHMMDCLAASLRPMGIKIKRPPKEVRESLPVVQLADRNSQPVVPVSEAEGQALQDASAMISLAVASRAGQLIVERNTATATVRQLVDGVWSTPRKPVAQGIFGSKKADEWENVPAPSPKAAAAIVAAFEKACGLDPVARKSRKKGACVAISDGKPVPLALEVASNDTLERAVVRIGLPEKPITSISELGVREKVAGMLQPMLGFDRGLLVVAAPAANGLSTSIHAVVSSADRVTRDFVFLEGVHDAAAEIENVKRCTWDVPGGVSPVDALSQAMRAYPQGIVTSDLSDPELAKKLVEMAAGEQFVVVGVRAHDSVDAIAKLLKLEVSRSALSQAVVGVLAGRLIRRVCPRCREAYATPPDLAAKLRVSVQRVPQLYRASSVGCRLCRGLGYASRTGVFELAAGDAFRKAILKGDRKLLMQVAAKEGMKSLNAAALEMVIAGETSLDELQRVFQRSS